MASNKIQIKRSVANSTVTGLSNGELAFTANGNILYIGDPSGAAAIPIGSKLNYGTLTANSVIVTNATSGIDSIQVGNVVMVGATQTMTANGSKGTAGDVLTSGGTGANMYWVPVSAITTNVNATYVWTNTHTFSNNVILNGGVNVNSAMTASGTTGTQGYVLTTNGAGGGAPYWSSVSALSGGLNTAASYTWTNTHTFQNTITFNSYISVVANAVVANATGVYTTGTVNAASHTAGATGTGTGGSVQNTTTMFVGNNTINTVITSAGLNVNGTVIANNTTLNANGVVINSSGGYFTGLVNASAFTTTGNANAANFYSGANLVVNSTNILWTGNTTTSPTITVANTGALTIGNSTTTQTTSIISVANSSGNVQITPAGITGVGTNITSLNATAITSGTLPDARLSSAVVNTSGSFTLAGNNTLAGTNTVISSNLTTTGASITGTSTDVSFRNGTFSGNLVISGTVITVNTAQLQVNDNIIQLAYNQTTADTVDTGFSSVAGNSTATWYSGIVRVAASSTNSAPVFRVFGSNTNPNTSATVDTSANTRTGFLQSYLIPYGTGGALVVNATNISVTANSTLAVAITANTLALSTALPGTSGGTGLSTIANNSLIFGNSTNGFNALAFNSTAGYVLQSNGTAIVYDTLDGGTF